MTVATVNWQKRPFDPWWQGEAPKHQATPPDKAAVFWLPAIPTAPSTEDYWLPTQSLPERTDGTGDLGRVGMIVWGGGGVTSDGFKWNTGSRYNPATDRWSPVSATGAPGTRVLHSAVWTGNELTIWGGCSGLVCSAVGDTGGRYDPGSDGWIATTLAGAPVARAEHSAIWTGDSMIVWGRLTEDGSGIAGGTYDLQACGDGCDLNCDGAVDVLDITLAANR